MSSTPHVIHQAQAREWLGQVDVPQILRKLVQDLSPSKLIPQPDSLCWAWGGRRSTRI